MRLAWAANSSGSVAGRVVSRPNDNVHLGDTGPGVTQIQVALAALGYKVDFVRKVLEGRPHILDAMKNREIHLVFITTEGRQSLEDSFSLRRAALMMKIPYYTTAAGALAAAQGIAAQAKGALEVRSLQSYGTV